MEYEKGYNRIDKDEDDEILLNQAIEKASKSKEVVLFVGLTENYESEGVDRNNIDLPKNQTRLINEICKVNKNVIIVLSNGAPISMPWKNNVKAIVTGYLAGEAGGRAIANCLLGFQITGDRYELVMPTEETCTKRYKVAIDKYPNPWSKCWNRAFLEKNKIRFPEHRFYEDVLFVYNGVMKSESYKIADFIVHDYASGRTNSMTTKINFKNIEDTVLNLKDFYEMRKNEYTEEIDIIMKKEIKMCKKRLDSISENLFGSNN